MSNTDLLYDKVYGCLIGGLIGDAMAHPWKIGVTRK